MIPWERNTIRHGPTPAHYGQCDVIPQHRPIQCSTWWPMSLAVFRILSTGTMTSVTVNSCSRHFEAFSSVLLNVNHSVNTLATDAVVG